MSSGAASSASPRTLAELRQALRAVEGKRPTGVVPIGLASVDTLLGGGLPRGRLTELSGRRSAGRTALALAALAAATGRQETAALVDVGAALDVRRAQAAGIELGRLLWVRAGEARRAIQAADLIVSAGGFGLVVVDFGEAPPRLPDASWLRLARAAERGGAAVLVVARTSSAIAKGAANGAGSGPWSAPVTGSFAALQLEAGRPAPRFLDGSKVLLGLASQLEVRRCKRGREGGEGGSAVVELRLR